MNTILKSGYVKARKNHHGDGSDYFDFAYSREGYKVSEFKDLGMSDEEIQSIIEAKARNFRISIGELYYCQTGVFDGELYTYRVIKAIHKICIKYDLYSED